MMKPSGFFGEPGEVWLQVGIRCSGFEGFAVLVYARNRNYFDIGRPEEDP